MLVNAEHDVVQAIDGGGDVGKTQCESGTGRKMPRPGVKDIGQQASQSAQEMLTATQGTRLEDRMRSIGDC